MNDILITIALGAFVMPIAIFFTGKILGKSVVTPISKLVSAANILYCALFFIVGKLGAFHLIWAAPLAYAFSRIVNLLMKRRVKVPLGKTIKSVEELAKGNLDIKNDSYGADKDNDLGLLIRSINALSDILRKLVTEVELNAMSLSSIGLNLSKKSEEMASRTSNQASSSEEISSLTEEITANIQLNSQNAKSAETIAQQAASEIDRLNKSMEKSIEASRKISDKISLINEIAFQTNILALNAAIEAARAGESGKGFSVVAMEVRKLAERSKQASDEINKLSQENFVFTSEASKLLNGMVPQIKNNADIVHEIALHSAEQAEGAHQISTSIQNLNQDTQQNANISEELSVNAHKLFEQSEKLKELLLAFRSQGN